MKKVPEEERLTAQECLTAWQRVLTVGRSYCHVRDDKKNRNQV